MVVINLSLKLTDNREHRYNVTIDDVNSIQLKRFFQALKSEKTLNGQTSLTTETFGAKEDYSKDAIETLLYRHGNNIVKRQAYGYNSEKGKFGRAPIIGQINLD